MYNPQEGLRGKREGGPYLDEVELQRDAERRAAAINKGKKDDEDKVTAHEILVKGGVLGLVPANQLIDNVSSNPGSVNAGKPGLADAVEQAVHASGDTEDNLAVPVNPDAVKNVVAETVSTEYHESVVEQLNGQIEAVKELKKQSEEEAEKKIKARDDKIAELNKKLNAKAS
jgi:hypothetical protein